MRRLNLIRLLKATKATRLKKAAKAATQKSKTNKQTHHLYKVKPFKFTQRKMLWTIPMYTEFAQSVP